jgi:glycosyltransferase involved in cell wall biosynthesis
VLLFHSSNLRPVKRFDVLLEAFARVQSRAPCKLLVLAGGDFNASSPEIARLGIRERIVVRENVTAVEDYLQASTSVFSRRKAKASAWYS